MRLTEARPGTRVLAFGGYQPARVLTNDELAATVDTTDEWIRSRVVVGDDFGRLVAAKRENPGPRCSLGQSHQDPAFLLPVVGFTRSHPAAA